MAHFVYQKNKKSGVTYVYESKSYWDREKKQSRAKRKLVGKLDPVTGAIVPTRGRKGSKNNMGKAHLIFYVENQETSTRYFTAVLAKPPRLNVPGMSEFLLNAGCILGLMPSKGIVKLLGDQLPHPDEAAGIPRAELYLMVDEPNSYHQRALRNGAKELSPLKPRDWGHEVAYSLDPDGHVLAFARMLKKP